MDAVRLNNTITEIENEAKKLKSTVEIYTEFKKTLEEVSAGIEMYENVESDINKVKVDIEESLKRQFDFLDNLDKRVGDIKSGIGEQLELLRQENKNLYKDLEDSMSSKLEKHKSDIQVDIRNEGIQIERGFKNSLDEKFISFGEGLKNKFDSFRDSLEGKINKQSTYLIIISAAMILNLMLEILIYAKK